MTRLYDRMLTGGCAPLKLSKLPRYGPQLVEQWIADAPQRAADSGGTIDVDKIRQAVAVSDWRRRWRAQPVVASRPDRFPVEPDGRTVARGETSRGYGVQSNPYR